MDGGAEQTRDAGAETEGIGWRQMLRAVRDAFAVEAPAAERLTEASRVIAAATGPATS